MKLKIKLTLATLLTIGLSSAVAYADTVTFTLTNPNETISYLGGTLTFDATVSAPAANGAAVFLNGDSFNVTAPITLNDSDFFSNFPLSLAPGTSFTGALFTLTVPANTLVGQYLGSFTLLGGANGNASSALGTNSFSANVITPEPSSILMLLAGIVITLLWVRFKGNLRDWAR